MKTLYIRKGRNGKPHSLRATDDVIQWLPVNALVIDDYQRSISPSKLQTMIQTFDINKVGTLFVNQRNGTYFLIDGQHRCEAAKKTGHQLVPCRLYRGLTREEEAELREAFGTRKTDTPGDIFRLHLAKRDVAAMAIKSIVEGVGLRLILNPGGTSRRDPKAICCVSALERIYKRRVGPQTLRRVLIISLKAWPDDPRGRASLILQGLSTFLGYYSEINDDELINRLSVCPPSFLERRARLLVETGEQGGYEQMVARAIFAEWNKRRRNHKLPDRFMRLNNGTS